jgi:hypothetical protein
MVTKMQCPIETQDVKENLKKRDWAFKNVGYGPANPELSNGSFWNDKANEWQTSVAQAKSMRCGNCSAFIQTPEMMECIRSGIDAEKDSFAQDVVDSAKLGFCELFDFKCAADRTCSAWLVGGPITSSKVEIVDIAEDDTTKDM